MSGTNGVRVSDLPRGVQPREKLARQGERSLSNSELMAVALGSGTRNENVMKIADGLLRKYGFEALVNLSLNEWKTNRGIGAAFREAMAGVQGSIDLIGKFSAPCVSSFPAGRSVLAPWRSLSAKIAIRSRMSTSHT